MNRKTLQFTRDMFSCYLVRRFWICKYGLINNGVRVFYPGMVSCPNITRQFSSLPVPHIYPNTYGEIVHNNALFKTDCLLNPLLSFLFSNHYFLPWDIDRGRNPFFLCRRQLKTRWNFGTIRKSAILLNYSCAIEGDICIVASEASGTLFGSHATGHSVPRILKSCNVVLWWDMYVI